jgi:hypothetical protein
MNADFHSRMVGIRILRYEAENGTWKTLRHLEGPMAAHAP